MAKKKELDTMVSDLRKEVSKLEGLVDETRRKEKAVVETPRKTIPVDVSPATLITSISPIPSRLGRKRAGEEGEGSGYLSSVVEVEEGKRRKVEEAVGPQVDPGRSRGTGPVMGLKVGGVG